MDLHLLELPHELRLALPIGGGLSRQALRRGQPSDDPRLVFLDTGTNVGFGEGANRGARLALERGASAVVFVNNDLTFPGGTLARLCGNRPPRS